MTMILFRSERTVSPSTVEMEDSGMAKITEFDGDGMTDGMFIRVQSWHDNTNHVDFDKMIGKKVRVTVEILDD